MTINLTDIIVAVLGLCSALVTGLLVPWLKTKLNTAQLEKLEAYVKIAVTAAEQLYGAGNGDAKFDYVVEYLSGKGLAVDRTIIEAKVKELFGKDANIFSAALVERDDEPNSDAVVHAKG